MTEPTRPDRVSAARRVLLVGVDHFDWEVASPLLEVGVLPNLDAFVRAGAMGPLQSTSIPVAPVHWTTLATGARADVHGILDAIEPHPATSELRLVGSESRRVKAIWNVATQAGLRSIVVGWPATHPAEPIRGVMVSDRYPALRGRLGTPWPLPTGAIHPPDLAEELAELRMHLEELGGNEIGLFVPDVAAIDQSLDARPQAIAAALAETFSLHAAMTALLEGLDLDETNAGSGWDLACVRLPIVGHLSRGFMRYRAPRRPSIAEGDFERYRGVVDGGYRLLDMLLGRLVELAGPDATVILASEQGFRSGEDRPPEPAVGQRDVPDAWVRPVGAIALRGHGVRADALVHGATILDVAPTVLARLGLPIGKDMPGRVFLEAFEHRMPADEPNGVPSVEPPALRSIESWELEPGDAGMHPPRTASADPEVGRAAIRQLVELGYAEFDPHEAAKLRENRRRRAMVAAISAVDARDLPRAVEAYREAIAESPDAFDPQSTFGLASCLLAIDRADECESLVAALVERRVPRSAVATLHGMIAVARGKIDAALGHFAEASSLGATLPKELRAMLELRIGHSALAFGRHAEAEAAFRKAIACDPDSAFGHHGLGAALLGLDRALDSAESLLAAIQKRFRWPEAHLLLGRALARAGRLPEAVVAFERSIEQRPSAAAHRALAELLARVDWDPPRIAEHRAKADELERGDR